MNTPNTNNIIGSFKLLNGNTKIAVLFEPLWGIPFILYNFYLSLYMKSQGITDQQIGFLISIGFITGAFFSLFGGVITDKLGRKKTTLIFDLISWPGSILILIFANNFWMFAMAQIVNSSVRIVTVSWNLMVIEDADNQQRVAAFNILNILTISMGIFTPLAGIVVRFTNIEIAERCFLVFSFISMIAMIVLRNHYFVETKIGKEILERHKNKRLSGIFSDGLYRKTFATLRKNHNSIIILVITVLFNVYFSIGTSSSLYFAPYMNEVLGIDKPSISILGGVNSGIMLLMFLFIVPIISRFNRLKNIIFGFIFQLIALLLFTIIPIGSLSAAIISIIIFALGMSISKPFLEAKFAEETDENQRAGIYSLQNTLICIFNAIVGIFSGYIYDFNPKILYYGSALILILCLLLTSLIRKKNSIE